MSKKYIPKGFQTVSPYFIVKNAFDFIKFLENAFDAELVYSHLEDGLLVHARVKIGNSLIELSEAKNAFPAMEFACQVFVEDCDKSYQRAIEAGAESLGEPSDMAYGLRAGYVKDSWGNQWYISTQINKGYSPKKWEKMEKKK